MATVKKLITDENAGIIFWAIGSVEDLPPRFRPNPRGNARTPPGSARIRANPRRKFFRRASSHFLHFKSNSKAKTVLMMRTILDIHNRLYAYFLLSIQSEV